MLIVTLRMKTLLALVFITVSLIHCQAITVRDDDSVYDVTPKSYTYSDSDLTKSEIAYRQEDYYKPLRRSDIRPFQYPPDDSSQELDYQLQPRQDTENYPFTQRGREPQTRRPGAKKPQVEQYLKEVTPTTKTAYNQRPDIRLTGQPRDRVIKQQAEELQRGILKQQSIQYVLQSDLQQKSQSPPQVQYVLTQQTAKPPQLRQNEQPDAEGLTAYQNALLAHQKVLETESQDATSRSSIFVMHSIPKKPVRKIVKPTSTDDIEQYAGLQQLQQKQPNVYERQEPAEIRYQAKLEDGAGDTNFQASTETPRYHEKLLEYQKLRQHLQDLSQYQQVSTEQPVYQQENPQQLTGYQQVLSDSQGKIPGLNAEEVLEYRTPSPKQQIPVQYQPIYVKKGGPKYLPEPKSLRYQPQVLDETQEKYQQVVNIPAQRPEPLISYEAALAKLQSEKLLKTRQPRLRPQVNFPQPEDAKAVRYAIPSGGQDTTPPETEYLRIGEIDKYRPDGNAAALIYRQSHQNANVRYYRRPAISYSQYQ